MPGLYLTETGVSVHTHSMLKTFRRCPKQAQYKYVDRLKPKIMGRPLRRGTWIHELLETHYKGGDWKAKHLELTEKFNNYFEEEREAMGDLPDECLRIMRGYLWHYKDEVWIVHEVEFTLECEFPDGSIYRGKIDMLIENQYGLWIVDHKTHKSLPNLDFRLLDAQSSLYVWAAHKNDIPVQGHIWNYIKTKPPGRPHLLKDGTRLSKAKMDTDFPTYVTELRRLGIDPKDYAHQVNRLRRMRYAPGEMQTSPFFRRDILEKSPGMVKQIAQEAYLTAKRMDTYPFDRGFAERNVDKSCTFMCSYTELCTMELFGGNPDQIRRSRYTVGDPLDYYYDNETRTENMGESEG